MFGGRLRTISYVPVVPFASFQDKYEIVQWHFDTVCETRLAQVGRTLTWQEGNLLNLKELYCYKTLYKSAFRHARGYQNITAYGRRKLKEILLSVLYEKHSQDVDSKILFQVDFFVRGIASAFASWGKEEIYDLDEYAEYIDSCMPLELKELINSGVRDLNT